GRPADSGGEASRRPVARPGAAQRGEPAGAGVGMSHELERLETLAEIDGLIADLERFSARDVSWPAAREAEARLKRLLERTATMRVRIEAPLVVATLGGTGVGKSTLVNALVGD